MRLALAVLAALVLAVPAAAQEYAPPPGTPPAICAGSAFVDLVGTRDNDRLQALNRATRVWGLGGDDVLLGSATRASCLLGGAGNDRLFLNGGGGVAHGNRGRDVVFGSDLGDVINPGKDADGVVAGAGDDKITTRDGRPEVVDCGVGADIVKGDRSDVLLGCESTNLAGKSGLHVRADPERAGSAETILVRVDRPGRYRVLYVNNCRGPGEVVTETRGRTILVVAPAEGWCPGRARLAVARDPGYTLPLVPVSRASFTVR